MTDASQRIAELPSTDVDNGVLARVPSQFIAQAGNSLPDATGAPGEEMRVENDAGWIGRVRLSFTKQTYRRPKGKFSATFWSCRHAEAIAPAGEGEREERKDRHVP